MRYVSGIMFIMGSAMLAVFMVVTVIGSNHLAEFRLIATVATFFIGSIAASLLSNK